MLYILYMLFMCLIIIITKYYFYLSKIKNLKTAPKGKLLTGHIGVALDINNIFENTVQFNRTCGKTYKVFAGPIPVIVTTDKNLIEHVLTSPMLSTKSKEYRYFKLWLGDGLLLSSGEKWKKHRKILTPAFHYNVLEDFVTVFQDSSRLLIKNFENDISESLDIYTLVSKCTLDAIYETSMGMKINAQTNNDNKYFKSVKKLCKICLLRSIYVTYRLDFVYKWSSLYQKELELTSFTHKKCREIVKNKREELEKFETSEDFFLGRKVSFLDILIASNSEGKLTDEEIRGEIDTFLFEGHDTTSIVISMILYNFAKYPEVQEKAYEEVTEVLSSINDDLSLNDLKKMTYLEMVCKEGCRMYPSVPFIGRDMLDEFEFEDYTLPMGISLLIDIFSLHRDEDVFPDSERFIPERFTFEECRGRHPFSYLPFSAGFRNCIGQKYAMLLLKTVLATVLLEFELLPSVPEHKPILIPTATLNTRNGVCIGLRKRKK